MCVVRSCIMRLVWFLWSLLCPYRSSWSAGCCLWSPFAHTAVRPSISFSIGPVGMGTVLLHWEALELRPVFHPDRSLSLTNLALALWTRFRQSAQHKDLEEAILLHREALELLPAPHPHRYMSLDSLASALFTRFKQSGGHEDLEKAILLHWKALELLSASHPDRSACFMNLASTLGARFRESGRREGLECWFYFNTLIVDC